MLIFFPQIGFRVRGWAVDGAVSLRDIDYAIVILLRFDMFVFSYYFVVLLQCTRKYQHRKSAEKGRMSCLVRIAQGIARFGF